MHSLETYTNELENALERKKPFRTYNRDVIHAAETVTAVFRFAKKEVNILSNRLDIALYGEYILYKEIIGFLKQDGTKLNVLIETNIANDHPMMQIRNEFPDKVTIKIVPERLQSNYGFNCMIVDDFGYRYGHNRDNFSAVTSFFEEGQKEMNDNLKRFFNFLNEESENYEKDYKGSEEVLQ